MQRPPDFMQRSRPLWFWRTASADESSRALRKGKEVFLIHSGVGIVHVCVYVGGMVSSSLGLLLPPHKQGDSGYGGSRKNFPGTEAVCPPTIHPTTIHPLGPGRIWQWKVLEFGYSFAQKGSFKKGRRGILRVREGEERVWGEYGWNKSGPCMKLSKNEKTEGAHIWRLDI